MKTVVLFGGGVNSVAMLLGMYERKIVPDHIVFSDTGSEHPNTYAYMKGVLARWLIATQFPAIEVVKLRTGTGDESLEDELNRRKALPALAYGLKTCSLKWKRRPYEAWAKQTFGAYPAPGVREAVGYDAGESHRHGNASECVWMPLVEWGWDRSTCIAVIESSGLPVPPKSSCYFCPAMKVREILKLRDEHPALYERACEIEADAIANGQTSGSTIGLGRRFRWSNLEDAPIQPELDFPCDCGR